MAGKSKRVLIRMVSTGTLPNGQKTGVYYTTQKHPSTDKLRLKKYDRRIRKIVEFEEKKIK